MQYSFFFQFTKSPIKTEVSKGEKLIYKAEIDSKNEKNTIEDAKEVDLQDEIVYHDQVWMYIIFSLFTFLQLFLLIFFFANTISILDNIYMGKKVH